ncbi:MAG TPA: carbamoyltransferase HypF [Vicinamibacteria bacterium]|nr:carbamoyltransferase HypF [Vicinamibacteria bacterium]
MQALEAAVRERLLVRGAVQGVGFRPFVYRLAQGLELAGWVENSAQGVTIEIEGPEDRVAEFRRRLVDDKPARAAVEALEPVRLGARGHEGFAIRESDGCGERSALVLPDVATCHDCLREILDSDDRRYRYPFTNCTNCGPRYSIIRDLPYDRERTTMARFALCSRCREEYRDPEDRRFHAEPIACPECGPQLTLWDARGRDVVRRDGAILAAAAALRDGLVVAVKGLGGFHLLVDARRDSAVRRLRQRKGREAKPFAVMVPSLVAARRCATLEPQEEALLASHQAPIVLVRRRGDAVAPSVAPDNPYLGLLLPYTPLHHLLLAELDFPVVATSGNRSDEPICTDEREALERLRQIADLFLIHDRPIARPVDDSVTRLMGGREMLLRRARGYAPLPVAAAPSVRPVLAVGAHQKNTVALSAGGRVFLSPHVGDLETVEAHAAFTQTTDALCRLYDRRPELIACDAHPDYMSSQWARSGGRPVLAVQHHYAHVLAGMADNELAPPVLGVAWDGSGYGPDGTIWGGEFLRVGRWSFDRVARMKLFPLPGGERAVREPRRSALGALYALHGDRLFDDEADPVLAPFLESERKLLRSMLRQGVNCPLTSSVGRLFDAVAALTGLRAVSQFEGQAAMALEFAIGDESGSGAYPFELVREGSGFVLDWGPALEEVRRDDRSGVAQGRIALRFHNTLAEMIVATAERAGERRVVLSGGCFQNRYLTERAIRRLRKAGLEPYWHQRIPPNDGGIAVGQALAAARGTVGD